MNERFRFRFNVFFLGFLFVWPVLKTFYLNIDCAGRVESISTVLAVLVNGKSLLRGPFTMKVWIIWVVYCLFNVHFKGYHNEYSFVWWFLLQLLCPLVSMLVGYKCFLYNGEKFISYIFHFFLFFVFFGVINMVQATTERYSNDMGNSYLNNAIFIMPFLSLIIKNQKRIMPYYFIMAFLFLVILFSGERKALVGLFIMIMGFFFARNLKFNISSIFALFAVMVVAYWGATYIMENTIVGNRFNDQFSYTEYGDNFFLTLMGDRAYMYMDGFIIFLQHPWTGIGLTNFIYHPLNTNGFAFHTEYMVELTECGIIGSSFFGALYVGMIVRLVKMYKTKRVQYETIILSSALLAIISINFSSRTYYYSFYYLFFGILYAYSTLTIKKKIK